MNQAHIIGNGLIAKSFRGILFSKKCLLIAAGVSDSLETCNTEFQREEALIRSRLEESQEFRVIYFSTCSTHQSIKTAYINHKMSMEKLIAENARSYLIFRLPQAVGVASNKTLIPFFVQEMIQRKPLTVQLKAKRNLIDVTDVARIVHHIIEADKVGNGIINIAAKHSISVSQIVSEIAEILNCPFGSTEVESGESYDISIDYLEKSLPLDDPIFQPTYWKETLSKYVPLIVNFQANFYEANAKNID